VPVVVLALLVLLISACSDTPEPVEPEDDPEVPTAPEETRPDDAQSHDIQVFFTNLDLGEAGEVHPVDRTTDDDDLPAAALGELLAGPTAEERDEGYSSWFSPETAELMNSMRIVEGTAHVDFDSTLPSVIPNASTSAGSLTLLAELDATLEQFPDVTETQYALDGDVDAFYEWLQLAPPDRPDDAEPSTDDGEDDTASGEAVVEVFFTNTERGGFGSGC
jgi:spore germination protein GerM